MNYACKMHGLFILCFFFTLSGALDDPNPNPNHLSINCGGAAAVPLTSLGGRRWGGDAASKGSSSTKSTALNIPTVDPVPYGTARISRSQFSYTFPLTPGQKFIRFHFNPVSYHGFESFSDFFTVEAGPFTLLANFSASITARALSQNVIVKEFCVIVQQNQPLHLLFSPEIGQSESNYAFINGIEIVSVPSTLAYCHGGDSGIGVLGQKSVIYIDSSTALERVYHQNLKWGSLSFGNDIGGMFGIWASILQGDARKGSRNLRFQVCVDVGFRYLVRIHLFEVGLDLDFMLMIDDIVVLTCADLLQQSQNQTLLWYNYMVMVQGKKRVSKHNISISLHSPHELVDRQGPVEGFEVFKLSNHDLSLASPNPMPSIPIPSSRSILKSLLGSVNASATLLFTMISLLNIIVHLLQKMWGTEFSDEENEPSTRPKQPYRCFSLSEIQSATENFHSGYVIGKGGFGNVYKGFIDNGREIVAIKRLKPDSNQGEQQFWTEVEMLSVLRHVNLVSLLGFCAEQQEMMLVYEYMPCGTLADHLFKLPQQSQLYRPLSWKQRLQICIGAGRALDYLHTGHGIIHRDVKSSNILLDDKFVAKVSDFGLAKTGFGGESQTQHSTQVKGTRGYLDPDYCETRKPTKKSDIYSFGVVLLEVLCGRRALERHSEEDKCRLTTWAMDNISKGQVDRIVFPTLMAEASPDSLKTFVKVAKRCLHDEPKKRPAIVRVVMKLELALKQQEKAESLDPNEITSVENLFSSTDIYQKEKRNSMVPREKINIDYTLLPMDNAKSSSQNETRNVADNDRQRASNAQTVTSLPIEQINSTMINSEKKVGRRSMLLRISRKLLPWDAFWKTRKPSNKTYLVGTSVSAPMSRGTSNNTVDGDTVTNKRTDEMIFAPAAESSNGKEQHRRVVDNISEVQVDDVVAPTLGGEILPEPRPLKGIASADDVISSTGNSQKKGKMNFMVPDEKINVADYASLGPAGQILPHINLRIFTFSELKSYTKNFRHDCVLGLGGFGTVYKGLINEKSSGNAGSGTLIAVKRLNPESTQGLQEWQSEVDFLGRLSHPNLVKLFGYCWEKAELLLVYEFMAKGSLENHLFRRGASVQPLPWDIRLKILIGAARGLAFLHALDRKIIYRDFKASNILLDGSYQAKLSDFGLAKLGPMYGHSHVSTQVMGTYGYAAPEYVATGHLYVQSDVYGFGVVVLEMLTGLRVLDSNRPPTQHNLVDWMKPLLYNKKKSKHIVDFRLEGRYHTKSALHIAQLALNCLENEPIRRPSMEEIVETLERIDSYDQQPAHDQKPTHRRVHFSQ